MIKFLFIFFFFITICHGQVLSENQITNKRIFLFGETHFVKEKYDEMRSFVFEHLETLSSGAKVTMYFELPYSLNYAINKINEENDYKIFLNWFNNVYNNKGKLPSHFWTDYRDFILELIKFCDNKEIKLNLKCIDTERKLRRTTYILKSLEDNKFNTPLDSLLNVDYIKDNASNRSFLLSYLSKLSNSKDKIIKKEFLSKIEEALLIDCTICLERDEFMYRQFKNSDSGDNLVFGTFGLDHVVTQNNFSEIGTYFKMNHKIDTTGYKSFYNLLKGEFAARTFRIGILSLNQEMKFSDRKKPKKYENIMNTEERDFIKNLLKNKEVIRFYPANYDELINLSLHLDYVIIYSSSNYR